jgi:hypothetical protein
MIASPNAAENSRSHIRADQMLAMQTLAKGSENMKPLATVFAVLVLCCATQAAETFTWTGAVSSAWETPGNWNQSPGSGSSPGNGRTTDIVYINADPNTRQPVFSAGCGTRTVDTIDINANTNGVDVSLTVSGGSLTTTDLVTVKGKQAVADRTATITVSSDATFAPALLYFWGRDHASDGRAIGSFGEDVTVACCTTARGYVDITVTGSATLDLNGLLLDGNGTNLAVSGQNNGETLKLDCLIDRDQPANATDIDIEIY